MKKHMKKLLAFLMVFALMFSGSTMMIIADTSEAFKQAEALLKAIPDYSSITETSSAAYTAAFTAAEAAIRGLAELTDDEFAAITGYEKAFEAYIDLTVLKVLDGMPTEMVNASNFDTYITWSEKVDDVLFNCLPLEQLERYTTFVEDSEDPENETTTGFLAMADMYEQVSKAGIRLVAYFTTLSEEEMAAFEAEAFGEVMDQMPESFTEENVFDYIESFPEIQWAFQESYPNAAAQAVLDPEDVKHYYALEEEFEVAVGVHSAAIFKKLDQEIARICDIEKVSSYSSLKLSLFEQPNYDYLTSKIYAVAESCCVNCETIEEKLDNYGLFSQYEELFVSPYFSYGDVNGDYEINAGDALEVLRASVGKLELTEDQITAGDVDGNGTLNSEDALLILKYAVNKIAWFPVEEGLLVG